MSKGLDLIKRQQPEIIDGYPTGNIYIGVTKEELTELEEELKGKDNLVSMCENLAKLVGLKEKDYVELETLITKKLKALEIIKDFKGLIDWSLVEKYADEKDKKILKEVLTREELEK